MRKISTFALQTPCRFPLLSLMHWIGILNITDDSFSDGGKYLDVSSAMSHVRTLLDAGADYIDVGAAASNVSALPVTAELERERLRPVIERLRNAGVKVSVDTFNPDTQRWCLSQGVDMLNDINGFCHPEIYPALAASSCQLVVMHSVQGRGKATLTSWSPSDVWDNILRFFDDRLSALVRAGVDERRLIVDPGMGNFLGSDPCSSLLVLQRLPELKRRWGREVYVGLSRKGFLRKIQLPATDSACSECSENLLLTEDIDDITARWNAFAVAQGADYIRTHEIKKTQERIGSPKKA